ncbi:MAG: AMP-binding protein, partial [Aggregatilineales bacterium]
MPIKEGDLLWQPTDDIIEASNIADYMRWLAKNYELHFEDYQALHAWSTTKIADFWESLWDYFGLVYSENWSIPLADKSMPGAEWFPDARLNYAENIFAKISPDCPAILYKAEDSEIQAIHRDELLDKTTRLAHALRAAGVQKGDRVVAYLPNIPETIVSVLAVASIGAIWSSCSPDFGARSVLDRFTQIEPKVLIAVDGYTYNGRQFDRRDVIANLQAKLPTLEQTILIPHVADNTDG